MTLTHSFQIGSYQCAVVSDGIDGDPDFADGFPSVEPEAINAALAEFGVTLQTAVGSINCLVVRTGHETILVDTGLGDIPVAGFANLMGSLATAKVAAGEVSIVVLTHLHGDHFAGLSDAAGHLNFPNARVVVAKAEFDYWMSETTWGQMAEARVARLKAKLLPIRDRLTWIEGSGEIAAGVTLAAANGHTPGHSVVVVESKGEKFVHLADLIHGPFQVRHPMWQSKHDIWPEKAVEARRAWFRRAAEEKLLVLFYHFALPGLGRIEAENGGYCWKPI